MACLNCQTFAKLDAFASIFPNDHLPGKADIAESAGRFEPAKFEDQYEIDLVDLINQKRAGKPITVKERPLGY
jgi:non-homologous end joining protein Ku